MNHESYEIAMVVSGIFDTTTRFEILSADGSSRVETIEADILTAVAQKGAAGWQMVAIERNMHLSTTTFWMQRVVSKE